MILIIDNYDSFTYNLVQYLGELGAEMRVVRNDQTTVDEIQKELPSAIVISPGPKTPNEAGICLEVIDKLAGVFLFWECASGIKPSDKPSVARSSERRN